MAEHLASVPEESATRFNGDYPPRNTYRDRIRAVLVSRVPMAMRWGLPNSHTGSSYSSSRATNSCPSSNSGGDFAVSADNDELRKIAHQMIRDGYIHRMVEESNGAGRFTVMQNWFYELDMDCVTDMLSRFTHRTPPRVQLQDMSTSSFQDLVHKWIRALTVITLSVTELYHSSLNKEWTDPWFDKVETFGVKSIIWMLLFPSAIVPALKAENLRAIVDMYICISNASFIAVRGPILLEEIYEILLSGASILTVAISNAMDKVKTFVEDVNDWAVDIERGGAEIHTNTRLMVECIMSITEAWQSFHYSDNHRILRRLINHTTDYLKDLLLRKSEMYSNLSLRYMFLLNNSYFAVQVISSIRLTLECEKYMDRYLDVSWRRVLSRLDCKPKSKFCGLLHHSKWNNTSSVTEFESAFHENYEAQKFWKVPDPQLRHRLRKTIIEFVISGYRDYMKQHPEVEKHISDGSSSPDALEEMLGELFEGDSGFSTPRHTALSYRCSPTLNERAI